MQEPGHLLIVHPDGPLQPPGRETSYPRQLARRLHEAAHEFAPDSRIVSPDELGKLSRKHLGETTVMVVDSAGSPPGGEGLSSVLEGARKRVAVVSGPEDPERVRRLYRERAAFDALLDVGFVDRRGGSSLREMPYRFVFDAPTVNEAAVISSADRTPKRPIPWALATSESPRELELLSGLLEMEPGGVVCLRAAFPEREVSLLGVAAEAGLLSRSDCYVWLAQSLSYRDGRRFREALANGAAPCEIGASEDPNAPGAFVPGAFASVETFRDSLLQKGAGALYRSAKDFYLSKGTLGEHLREALRGV